MFNIQSLFLRALLALSIAVGAPAALAGPVYNVSINTAALAGNTGVLDLGLNGFGTPTPLFASITNFSGDFLQALAPSGDVSGDIESGVLIGNRDGFNYFDQAVRFGGLFSFDVSFEGDDPASPTQFNVALLNDTLDAFLGADGDLLTISLLAGTANAIDIRAPGLVLVSEVPEPREWLLIATGLFLIGAARRLQARG